MRNGSSLAGEGAGPFMEAPRGEAARFRFDELLQSSELGTASNSQPFGHVLKESLPKKLRANQI